MLPLFSCNIEFVPFTFLENVKNAGPYVEFGREIVVYGFLNGRIIVTITYFA